MFFNVSNHDLLPQQKEKAKERFGRAAGETYFPLEEEEIVDVDFPSVDPHKSSKEIQAEAKKVLAEIERHLDNLEGNIRDDVGNWLGWHVIHLQGEHVLTTLLVRELQARGFRVVASTTERHEDGSFGFVRFRDYPNLSADEPSVLTDKESEHLKAAYEGEDTFGGFA